MASNPDRISNVSYVAPLFTVGQAVKFKTSTAIPAPTSVQSLSQTSYGNIQRYVCVRSDGTCATYDEADIIAGP